MLLSLAAGTRTTWFLRLERPTPATCISLDICTKSKIHTLGTSCSSKIPEISTRPFNLVFSKPPRRSTQGIFCPPVQKGSLRKVSRMKFAKSSASTNERTNSTKRRKRKAGVTPKNLGTKRKKRKQHCSTGFTIFKQKSPYNNDASSSWENSWLFGVFSPLFTAAACRVTVCPLNCGGLSKAEVEAALEWLGISKNLQINHKKNTNYINHRLLLRKLKL